VPCLQLRHEVLLSASLDKARKPDRVAVMDLAFDYGGVVVRATDRPALDRDLPGSGTRASWWNSWEPSKWIVSTTWPHAWSPMRTT
jgi:hypothetical protein